MKKSKERTTLKITDFFLSNDLSPIFDGYDNSDNNNKNKKVSDEDKNDKQALNDNYLNLNEDEDESNIFLNNRQQKSQNNNKNKKKKLEEKEIDNHILIKSPSYFININSNSSMDKKRKLIFLDLSNNKTLELQQIDIKQNNFINPQEFNSAFPFQFCKIININDLVYITGGKLNDEFSRLNYNYNLGEKKCCKMKYNKETKEIEIYSIPSSIYQHQSHSLLYLKKFNTIVMCSGYKQKNCEYLNLSENKEWKRLYNLQKPRENALALVYNEKYIFLIGGKNEEGISNEDYDVIDFEIFLGNKVQNYWKTYGIKNRNLIERLGCGILYCKNEIYVLGGYNAKNEFNSWKINFEQDEDDNSVYFTKEKYDKIYKISSVENCAKINNYFKRYNNSNNLCYVGQQYFSSCDGFLFNISLGGQLTIIPENVL